MGHDTICQGVKSDFFITNDNSDEYEVEHDVVVFPDDEQTVVDQFVELGRKSSNCTDQQYFSMAIDWVIPTEIALLNLFPEVHFVDAVKDINK